MGEFIASRLSLGQAHTAAARLLREARIAAPELDARLLLCHAAGLTHEAYVAGINDALAPDAAARFGACVARRLAGEPVSRIVGVREFYGRPFRIDASTLDPRPDTETLIEAALELVGGEAPLRLLDLGTGSGCILATLLAELPRAGGVGIDKILPALELARANAEGLGVVGADLVGEPGHVCRREIGGIGNHKIEGVLHGLQPIAGDEARPVPDPQACRIGARELKSRQALVDADATGPRQLGQQRHEDAAAPRAEV